VRSIESQSLYVNLVSPPAQYFFPRQYRQYRFLSIFLSFFKRYLLFICRSLPFVLPFFVVLCRSYGKVSDSVRVIKYKIVFEKSYTSNWITEVFKIVKVQRTNLVTYLVENYRGKFIDGAFYELHRATHPDIYLVEKILRRRGNEVYVK